MTSESEILFKGLLLAGSSAEAQARLQHKTKIRRFISMFCLPPACWLAVFHDLCNLLSTDNDAYISSPSIKNLLVTAHWLKQQASFEDLAMRFNLSERTIRTFVWKYTDAIAALKDFKVRIT